MRSVLIATNTAITPEIVAVLNETGGLVLGHHEEEIQDPALTQEDAADDMIVDHHAAITGGTAEKEGIVVNLTTVTEMIDLHVTAADLQLTKTHSNQTVRSRNCLSLIDRNRRRSASPKN